MDVLIRNSFCALPSEREARRAGANSAKPSFWEAGLVSLFSNIGGRNMTVKSLTAFMRQTETLPEYVGADRAAGKHRRDSRGVGRRFQNIREIESRLWTETERRVDPDSDRDRICVMGFGASERDAMIDFLESSDVSLNAFSAGIHDILNASAMHETVSMLVVNGDAFGDLFSAVDALINFRKIRPNMSIIFVSSRVSSDDLSEDRKAICDATSRAPITMRRLRAAINTTVENKIERPSRAEKASPYAGGNTLKFRRGAGR